MRGGNVWRRCPNLAGNKGSRNYVKPSAEQQLKDGEDGHQRGQKWSVDIFAAARMPEQSLGPLQISSTHEIPDDSLSWTRAFPISSRDSTSRPWGYHRRSTFSSTRLPSLELVHQFVHRAERRQDRDCNGNPEHDFFQVASHAHVAGG